ncbi:hypothetical protein OEZ86_013692 [Tetradesmus obliquus]|nr:hypothetical protein OEZ86_013692 [Tetradesmus obliquus]
MQDLPRPEPVWNIPAEILQANVQALADVLHPCGRDTTAHALWVMVRCPELRHADEQQLRLTLRHLTQMVQHLDLNKPTLLAQDSGCPYELQGFF